MPSTFYYKDNKNFQIKAAGVLLYKIINNQYKFLLIKNYNSNKDPDIYKYEDIGGKVDSTDDSYIITAAREVEEETNGLIKSENLIDRLEKCKQLYVSKSKYVLFVMKASDDESILEKDDFGDYEHHDNFKRTINWHDIDIFNNKFIIKYKLNERLRDYNVINYLSNIHKNIILSKKIF